MQLYLKTFLSDGEEERYCWWVLVHNSCICGSATLHAPRWHVNISISSNCNIETSGKVKSSVKFTKPGFIHEMVIFRCCGFSSFLRPSHDFVPTVASSYFEMTKINSKSAGWNEMWGQVLIHVQLSSFEIWGQVLIHVQLSSFEVCYPRIRASGQNEIDEIMILIPG